MGWKLSVLRGVGAALVLASGVCPVVGQTCEGWRKPLPDPRASLAMVYDSGRQVTVMFGGQLGFSSGETWEWSGSAWSLRSMSGPSARYGHGLAYDAARGVTVLFGGTAGSSTSYSDETWEWDGTSWAQRNPAHKPPALTGHAMVYDATRGVVVLFGGWKTGGYTSDTWTWDGTDWTLLDPAFRPSPRYKHAMAYDSDRQVTTLFGGWGSGGAVRETWEWDGTVWTQRSPAASPSQREGPAMVYDSDRRVTTLYGGKTSPYTSETWEWDGTSWEKRTPVASPSARSDHGMVYDVARRVTVLFGGALHSGGAGGDTWQWNGGDWMQIATSGPSPRRAHAMAYDSDREVVVLFGGTYGGAETWEYDGALWTLKATTGPSSRYGHAMAYDSERQVVVLFGGSYGGAETWEWDGVAWVNKTAAGPSSRTGHAMVYDSRRRVVVLFGGSTGVSSNETWEWDGAVWTQRTPSNSPSPRHLHAMVYDCDRGVTVLFGGYHYSSYSTYYRDTWEWDGVDWTRRSAGVRGEPAARLDHAMVYDRHGRRTVLFGGRIATYTYQNDAWWWNGESWALMRFTGAVPRARGSHAMAYDSARGAIVLFGGDTYNGYSVISNGETWEWCFGLTRPVPAHVIVTTPFLLLSPGVPSRQLEVEIRGPAGELLPTGDYCLEYYGLSASTGTVDAAGVVTATPSAIASGSSSWVEVLADGVLADNQALIRCVDADLGVEHEAFRGDRIAFYAPGLIQGFDLAKLAADYDQVAATDIAYRAQRDLIGSLPYRGGLHYFVCDVTNDDSTAVCGLAGTNPIRLGWSFVSPDPKSCYIVADPVRPVPQWGIIFHELGHNFILASGPLYQFITTPGSMLDFTYSEGLATLCGMWTRHCLAACPSAVGSLGRGSIDTDFDNARASYQRQLVEYKNAGKNYRSLTPDLMDGIFYEVYEAYGPKAWFDLLSTFQPAWEGLPVTINDEAKQATWIVAAFSASAGQDLRDHFSSEYGFPIDNTAWPSMLAAAQARIAARPWRPPFSPDFDCDGDVDGDDFVVFRGCWTGPAMGPSVPGCKRADLDGDLDIDQSDYGIFQRCYSGAGPVVAGCAN
ncbi:MAG TPA: kelch repeat-containing protein [Phycisphaerae bacterium]|nr:kelch repeat-containing protein [Phycisphaerae bacterium]HRY68926.1 kelch repeat-containing protein [Phycisphaerae bacterium]HSA25753.1 kelch repeat-containing protein [Phycisphaerae bacterium]